MKQSEDATAWLGADEDAGENIPSWADMSGTGLDGVAAGKLSNELPSTISGHQKAIKTARSKMKDMKVQLLCKAVDSTKMQTDEVPEMLNIVATRSIILIAKLKGQSALKAGRRQLNDKVAKQAQRRELEDAFDVLQKIDKPALEDIVRRHRARIRKLWTTRFLKLRLDQEAGRQNQRLRGHLEAQLDEEIKTSEEEIEQLKQATTEMNQERRRRIKKQSSSGIL